MIKTIINRDGTKAKFELWRVETAIEKALHSCTGKDKHLAEELTSGNSIPSLSKNLASEVYSELKEYLPGRIITVELVQNIVERILMKKGYYVVAKEYILYRDRHARIRKQFLCTESVGQINVMSVIKRSNEVQPMSRDKILKRIRRECEEHSPILKCDPVVVAEKVAEGVYDGVTTRELDELTITIAKNMVIQHPDYEKLAARIAISGHQKDTDYHRHRSIPGINTQIAFVVWSLFHNTDQNGDHSPLLQKELYEYILENQSLIDEHINYERDFSLSIFGFQTLTRAYLMKALTPDFPERGIVERPQDMFMRVALGIHCVKPNKFVHPSQKFSDYERRTGELIDDFSIASSMVKARDEFVPDLDQAFQTYSYMSKGYFIHATPTLFYSGTPRPGLSSCFLLAMDSDSIRGIYKTLSDCALISKNAGGIGVHIHKIRANQSYIRGTAGKSNGIVPMLKVYNDTAKYVDQCFAPGTVVYTIEGPKNIENIKVKDKLLTSTGNFKPVERVLEHDYEGEIFVISHSGAVNGTKVTPEHQILAITNTDTGISSTLKERLTRGYVTAKMTDAKDLLLGDLVAFPVSNELYVVKENQHMHNGVLYTPITSISKEHYSGKVYDFEVSEEHTYVTELGACHNGGGKRKGAFAIYLACWHADILDFLELKLPQGQEHLRSRDLFYAFWRNDYFMECVLEDRDWYLMCPDECPGLAEVYGEDFVRLYEGYVEEGKYRKVVKAREVYQAVIKSRVECGVPYIGEKDSINRKSNQSNLGVIQSSNLCVSGDTYILTQEFGQIPIRDLVWKECIRVWNGEEWSATQVRQTGEHKDLLKVSFSNGVTLNCTPEHRFYLKYGDHHKYVEAKSLKRGDVLIDYKLPSYSQVVTNLSLETEIRSALIDNDLENLFKLLRLQLQTYGVDSSYSENGLVLSDKDHNIEVLKVEEGYKDANTYCFTESKRHMGMFNGILTGQCTEIALYSDTYEHGTCFTADTEIVTETGIRKIVDCDGKNVFAYFDNDVDLGRAEHYEKATLINNGIKTVFEVKTQGNKPLKATADHPILVRKSGPRNTKVNTYVWKKVSELVEGDLVYTPGIQQNEKYNIDIDENLDDEWLSAGWMLGDGWMTKGGWGSCFGPTDTYARNIVIPQMRKWDSETDVIGNGHRKSVKTYVQPNGVTNWQTNKTNFKLLLQDRFGFTQALESEKCIPYKVKLSSPKEIANFLSGLFSADGCVVYSRGKLSINLSSASETLLHDAQSLLIPFGIKASVRFGEVVKTSTGRFQGTLTIHGSIYMSRFMKSIGFRLCPIKEYKFKQNYALKLEQMTRDIYHNISKVICVKEIGKETVYDLSLPKAHNFVANGHIVHNCNLASIALPRFVEYGDAESPYYDYRRLHEVAQIVTRNINKVIDRNYYPTPESERSNYRHRPIGIGVQGLWDVFMMFRLPFGSPEAIKLDKTIFETIYHGALTASLELAKEEGPYSSFWYNGGCPLSKGLFQFDLWADGDKHSGMWDWEDLRSKIMEIGVRNSELIAPMPTASTSQILGWTECFEPIKSNLYKRKTSSGEFIVINKYLYKDIEKLGLDIAYIREQIEANGGSVQKIEELPIELKELYKTVWDMDQTLIVDHCASRSPYVSQCCSMNLYFDVVDPEILMKVDIYSWMKGIKTQYYTHSRSLTKAKQHHSSDNKSLKENSEKEIVIEGPVCRMEEGCLMCGS